MKSSSSSARTAIESLVWLGIIAAALALDRLFPGIGRLRGAGFSPFELAALVAGVPAFFSLLTLANKRLLARRGMPEIEGVMIGRVYRLAAVVAGVLALAYGLGGIETFGAAFAAFGGMLLGWSLQAPVSGFAAWVLVSLKRPFRPGDRIQLPQLGLTGDVTSIGPMYTTLNQVGGAIGSEEAVGRHILLPNAMLFGQVVINYTVAQDAAYMLDELVIRITFDSDWEQAEKILLDAANEVTGDIIEATGIKPYIRSDIYDYGVYLRLRYQTRVKDRVEISYLLQKRVFNAVRNAPSVDFAIPFIYSYRAGVERKEEAAPFPDLAAKPDKEAGRIRQIPAEKVHASGELPEAQDVEQVARSVAALGLLQPIVVVRRPGTSDEYDLMAGHLRLAACKKLGWKTIPAIVMDSRRGTK